MKTKLLAVALVVLGSIAVATVAACGGDKAKSLPQQVCERADSCNALAGLSVAECVEGTNLCLAAHTSSERADWETATKVCLSVQVCATFVDCYLNQVPYC
jgi:hypothetical protein